MRTLLTPEQVSAQLPTLPGWAAASNRSLSRTITFADHPEAFAFITRVALISEALDHHADIRIVYNRVELTLSTFDSGGVTARDVELATRINKILQP